MAEMKIGTLIDTLWRLRERKRRYENEIAAIEKEMTKYEEQIKHHLDEQHLTQGRGSKAQVTLSSSIVPQMESPEAWPKFYRFISRTKNFHLLERRLSVLGCREFFEQNMKIPGVVPFEKRKLSLTTVKES